MRTTEEYAAMIPTAPPFDLVGYLREKGKMQTEVISYKWLGRDDADSWLDCDDCQADLRPSAATKSALLWCSACGGHFLAEYLPREHATACDGWRGTGYSGVQIADAEVMEIISVAAAFPDGSVKTVRGTMEGRIGYEEKGENGFGYDPIFYLPEYGCTSAELSMEEKNKISHRGKALRAIKEELK